MYESFLITYYSEWIKSIHTPEIRQIFIYTFLIGSDLILEFFFSTLFIYWFSSKYRDFILSSCSAFILGLLATDYIIYSRIEDPFFGPLFSNSIIYENIFLCYLLNIVQWAIIFVLSVKLSIFIKNKNHNHSINSDHGPLAAIES